MHRHYLQLWALLLTAFLIFAAASAFEMPELAGHKLKSSRIVAELTAAPESEPEPETSIADTIFTAMVDSVAAPVAQQFPAPPDTAAQTILFIGDSMLEGLGPRMAAYAEQNGHKLYNVVWYSSTSEVWGKSDKLKHYINLVKPTFVFVSLGANELFVKGIKDKRRKYVKKIVADIDTIPYLWIGPPNWKPDTGINELVADETDAGCFFLSDGMHFERARDGAHPTRKSAAAWLDSVARWMPQHAAHPIKMDTPAKAAGKPKRIFVHQPSEK